MFVKNVHVCACMHASNVCSLVKSLSRRRTAYEMGCKHIAVSLPFVLAVATVAQATVTFFSIGDWGGADLDVSLVSTKFLVIYTQFEIL